ncbi:hypothetical protein [Nonomuraea polychroma]|uniref:hypothetical protein n=1 Tax=Nonomuraea polychroma TaxID=46176 RepID=UPI0013E2E5BD|nr:hypothetical protein [Nonomuraea polychroma]
MTVGTRPGSRSANAPMTAASSAAKAGVAFSQTGPWPVGQRGRGRLQRLDVMGHMSVAPALAAFHAQQA